jgi:phosphohistidine phosphatase SixA
MSEAPSLKVIFVRHGRRTYAKEHRDEDDPLDESEREAVVTRRETLEKAGVRPCHVFTSALIHTEDAGIGARRSRIASAERVHVKGRGAWLCSAR